MSYPVVKTTQLTKSYGSGVIALDGLDLSLEAGRIYGLVGNNGAGKTTLLKLITGLSKPTSGSLSLFSSVDTAALQAARKNIGALIDSPAFSGDLTPEQNLTAVSMLKGKVNKQEVKDVLELMGISGKQIGKKSIRRCSFGQKQRYGIAAALFGKPELLILDEPANGLDPSGMIELREILTNLNRTNGVTIIISSHVLAELHKLATDYIFIDNGKLITQITAEALDAKIASGKYDNLEDYFLKLVKEARK